MSARSIDQNGALASHRQAKAILDFVRRAHAVRDPAARPGARISYPRRQKLA
jgi:hypothetical protein